MKLFRRLIPVLAALTLLFAVVGVGRVAAQEPDPVAPVAVEFPEIDFSGVISSAAGLVGTFAVIMVTMLVIRLVPKFIAGLRRILSAATR